MKLGVLVYLEHENKVLMIHRQKEDEHKGYWLAPGGKIEKNEAPHETAVREYQEETGLTPEGLQIKAVLSFPDLGDSPFGDEWQVFLAAKCCIGGIVWNKAFFGNDSKLQDSYLKGI